jgi:DNA-binding transcriptional LysR family regulator
VLRISQPALTVSLAKLERELKTELIVRGVRPIKLTTSGEVVYRAGQAQSVALKNLRTELSDLQAKRINVRVGMIDSLAAALTINPKPLNALETSADIALIVNNSRYLRMATAAQQIDCAFAVSGDTKVPLTQYTLCTEQLVLVCSPKRLSECESDLSRDTITDFICYDQPSASFKLVDQQLHQQGVRYNPRLYSSSADVMLRMVRAGRGASVLPYSMVRESLGLGDLALPRYSGNPVIIDRPISLVMLQHRMLPSVLRPLSEQIATVVQQICSELLPGSSR